MSVDVGTLCRELAIPWTEGDLRNLQGELEPYLAAFTQHLASGEQIPCHIDKSGCLQAPITDVADPEELFRRAQEEGAGVGAADFEVRDYPGYWITIHPSDTDRKPPVPVVMLLLKRPPAALPLLEELRGRCSAAVGARVGTCSFLAFNLPGFHWELHTDDEYEAVCSRVHVPLRTTAENLFVWARDRKCAWGDWLLARHLKRGSVYQVRTDVPHTVINGHPSEGRLHLILDVEGPFVASDA